MRREDASIGELFDVYLVYFLNHPDDPPSLLSREHIHPNHLLML
jgi:hypothetical protein